MVSQVVKKDAMRRHTEVQLGTRTGQQQRGSITGRWLEPRVAEPKSSHIHITKQRSCREVDELFGLIRGLMIQTCSLSLNSLGTFSVCTLETAPPGAPLFSNPCRQAKPFKAGDHSGDFFLPGSEYGAAKQKRCSLSVSWARLT